MEGPLGELTVFFPRRALRSILGFCWSFIAKVQIRTIAGLRSTGAECRDVTQPSEFRQDSNHDTGRDCREGVAPTRADSSAFRMALSRRPIRTKRMAWWRPVQRTVFAHSHRLSLEFGSLSSTGKESACESGSVYVTARIPLGETSIVRHKYGWPLRNLLKNRSMVSRWQFRRSVMLQMVPARLANTEVFDNGGAAGPRTRSGARC